MPPKETDSDKEQQQKENTRDPQPTERPERPKRKVPKFSSFPGTAAAASPAIDTPDTLIETPAETPADTPAPLASTPGRDKNRPPHRSRDSEKHRSRRDEEDRYRDKHGYHRRDRSKDRHRSKRRERSKDRDRSRHRERSKDRDRSKERERSKGRDRSRNRERSKDRERSHRRDKDRDREHRHCSSKRHDDRSRARSLEHRDPDETVELYGEDKAMQDAAIPDVPIFDAAGAAALADDNPELKEGLKKLREDFEKSGGGPNLDDGTRSSASSEPIQGIHVQEKMVPIKGKPGLAVMAPVEKRSIKPEYWEKLNRYEPTREPSNSTQCYFLDTQGDENNIMFGGNFAFTVPNYNAFLNGGDMGYYGKNAVIGIMPKYRIVRRTDDGKAVVIDKPERISKVYSAKRSAFASAAVSLKQLDLSQREKHDRDPFDIPQDYVPLSESAPGPRKRKREQEILGAGIDAQSTPNEDEDLEVVHEDDGDPYVKESSWVNRQRHVELGRMVEREPQNVSAWLEFLDLHDKMHQPVGRERSFAENQSNNQIKLEIMSHALAANQGNEDLLMKYMDIYEKLWDPQRILMEWKNILGSHPTLIRLWIRFLNFRQTDFLSFTFEGLLDDIIMCIGTVRDSIFGQNFQKSLEEMEEILLYLCARAMIVCREAGYTELSFSILQAVCEYSLLFAERYSRPETEEMHVAVVRKFGSFWDSEVLRLGEPGAGGWNQFAESKQNGAAPPEPLTDLHLPAKADKERPTQSWYEAEVEYSKKLRLSMRAADAFDRNDVYRMTMPKDIKPYLYSFRQPSVRMKLLTTFAMFFGLPPVVVHSTNATEMTDAFLRNCAIRSLDNWFWAKKDSSGNIQDAAAQRVWEGMAPPKQSGFESPFEFKIENGPVPEESLFTQGKYWFNIIERMKLEDPFHIEFIGHALRTLVQVLDREDLALYLLAFDWANHPSEVRKTAKWIIKRKRKNIRLYSAYAQIEIAHNGLEAGRKIFQHAISLRKGKGEEDRRDLIYTWQAWIWEELCAGEYNEAWRLLHSIRKGRVISEIEYEAVKHSAKNYVDVREDLEEQGRLAYLAGELFAASIFTDLAALACYLYNDTKDVEEAAEIHHKHIWHQTQLLKQAPEVIELCYTRLIRLLYFHATNSRPYRPGLLRHYLENALAVYPNNTHFLAMYAWNEGRTKIENRIRNVLFARDGGTVEWYLFCIYTEMHMATHYNVHTVRRLFERATKQHPGSSALWNAWMEWEKRQGDEERMRVLYRQAWKSCPWNKEMGLKGFTLGLDEEEEMRIIRVMEEKGLRVHETESLRQAANEKWREEDEAERRRREKERNFVS